MVGASTPGQRALLHVEEDLEAAVLEPLVIAVLDGGIGLADALHLAALDRQHDAVGAAVALDQLEFHAERIGEQQGRHGHRGAGAGAADQQFLLEQVLAFGDARFVGGDADPVGQLRTADPVELERIELHAGMLEQRLVGQVAADHADYRTVFRRDVEQMIGRGHLAGARHVLRHEGRLARQVIAHVTRDGARPLVVIPARGRRDDEGHLLAAIELLDRLRLRGREQRAAGGGERGCGDFEPCGHDCSPPRSFSPGRRMAARFCAIVTRKGALSSKPERLRDLPARAAREFACRGRCASLQCRQR